MTITKCDLCEREIEGKSLQVSVGFSPRVELCQECARPIVKGLTDLHLLEEQLLII